MVNQIAVNQFAMSAVVGMQDLDMGKGCVISAVIDSSAGANTFGAGTPMKLVTTSSGIPKVVPITSDADDIFAIALYSVKNGYYGYGFGNGALSIAMKDAVVYMISGGAINARQGVQSSQIASGVTGQVSAQSGAGNRIGFALDAATAAGQLIRVYLEVPSAAGVNTSKTVNLTATLAQINAGLVLIPGQAGKQITVTNFIERVTGTFTTGTSVNLQSDTTSVIVESTAEAGLTNGAVLGPFSANVTLGAGFASPLPAGEGLKVANVGAAQAGGTSINFIITYTQA